MWSSVQCGPDPFKASLQAIHQQHALVEQSRASHSAVGHRAHPFSTASSRPLVHSQQPFQWRAPAPIWANEYLRSQPASSAAQSALPVHSGAASSWLTEYTSFHGCTPVAAGAPVHLLNVDEYSRTLTQQPVAQQDASIAFAVSQTHQSPPQFGASFRPPAQYSSLTAVQRPFAAATASFPLQSLQPATHHVPHLPAIVSPLSTLNAPPAVSPLSIVSTPVVPSTITRSHSSQPVTSAASEAAQYAAVQEARLHEALYGDEHELSDAEFIHNGQWQHFTAHDNQAHSPEPAHLGVSAHIIQQMTVSPQPPQQRYIAEGEERDSRREKTETVGVDVGVLEFGSEWDANGRVWDWVVRERQAEEAQQMEDGMYDKSITATAGVAPAGGLGEMDVLLKEFYL